MTTVFFIQKSPALAGSQKSLLRLMKALKAPWMPVLIAGAEGWLTEQTRAAGIPVIVEPFPSSRSLRARLWGNRRFGRKVTAQCRPHSAEGCLVHGNDHIQSLSALEIARALRVPSFLTVRSGAMTQRDFFKYSGHRHDRVIAVGEKLFRRMGEWGLGEKTVLIENGVEEAEIVSSSVDNSGFPDSVLVPGSVYDFKGWRDLVDALVLLEEQGEGGDVEFVLLGNDYAEDVNRVVGADRLKLFRIRHIALTPNFKETISQYRFAVHPSRSESFGMALLEVLAAGVPVLTSRTGVAEKVIADSRFLFEPRNPADLAEKLDALMNDFSGAGAVVEEAQKIIRSQYCVSRTADQYMTLYQGLIEG